MRIEIREDSVFISGYVNAVERYSKPIVDMLRGKIEKFIERIKAGVFKTALKRNDNVKVLLNHDHTRELANTKDGTAILVEDNIGLRAEVTITDAEVIEKARQNKLVGWSFGFYPNADEIGSENGVKARTVTDLDLVEVSILDSTTSPAYYGTSIMARSEGGEKAMSTRDMTDEVLDNQETEETTEETALSLDDILNEIKSLSVKIDEFVGSIQIASAYETEPQEEEAEEGAEDVEDVEEDDDKKEEESRAIDYSDFENRLASL